MTSRLRRIPFLICGESGKTSVYLCSAISTSDIFVRATYHTAVSETGEAWAELRRCHRWYTNPRLEVLLQIGGFLRGFQMLRRKQDSIQGTMPLKPPFSVNGSRQGSSAPESGKLAYISMDVFVSRLRYTLRESTTARLFESSRFKTSLNNHEVNLGS